MAYDRDPAGQTHRGAFFRCFLASFLLVLVAAGACVYFNAVDRQLFETALLENVDYAALGMDADSMRSFAEETVLFLTTRRTAGNPASRWQASRPAASSLRISVTTWLRSRAG